MTVVQHTSSGSLVRPTFATLGLVMYGALVAYVTLTPTPIDRGMQRGISVILAAIHRRGVPEWFGYAELEFSMNIVMFVPLGFFLTLLFARNVQWLAIFLLPAVSVAIELTQLWFLASRYATVPDVIANSVGGWIGMTVAVILRALVHARDRKVMQSRR